MLTRHRPVASTSLPTLENGTPSRQEPATSGSVVRVNELSGGFSPRLAGESARHVESLIESCGSWPPLLVERSTMRVIDGMHRLSAARLLGLETVRVNYFDGTTEEARIEAIRANNSHGLPLTLEERRTSAAAILMDHADWSDRRVAGICGLSPKTVGSLRAPSPQDANEMTQEHRIGRDGLSRRIRRSNARARVLAALAEDPDASLRAVAVRAGTSPETVRTIRRSLAASGEDGDSQSTPAAMSLNVSPILPSRPPSRAWSTDAAISSTPEGSAFGAWFERSDLSDEDIVAFLDVIPLSRVYEVIDDAFRRARAWEAFGCRLRARVR